MQGYLKYAIKRMLKKPLTEEESIISNINRALYEVHIAKNNFDMVVGADNVELAILELNTAEKRYRNLLMEAKDKGLNRFSGTDINFLAKDGLLE